MNLRFQRPPVPSENVMKRKECALNVTNAGVGLGPLFFEVQLVDLVPKYLTQRNMHKRSNKMEITEVVYIDFSFNLNTKYLTVLTSSYKKTSQSTTYTKYISIILDYSDLNYFTFAWMNIFFHHLCSIYMTKLLLIYQSTVL